MFNKKTLLTMFIASATISCASSSSSSETEDEAFVRQYEEQQKQKQQKLAQYSGTPSYEIIEAHKENEHRMRRDYMNKEICIKNLKAYHFRTETIVLTTYPIPDETKDNLITYEFRCEGERTEDELASYNKDLAQICGSITEVKTEQIFTPTKYLITFKVENCKINQ